MSPKRRVRHGEPLRYAVELVVFLAATASDWAVGQHVLAVVFAPAVLVSGALDRTL